MYEINIVTSVLPTGQTGVPYKAVLEAETRPYTEKVSWWCDNRLPEGLQLDAARGRLHGTTDEAFLGTIAIWAKRADSGTSRYRRLLLQIESTGETQPKIVRKTFAPLVAGNSCSLVLEATGGRPPYQWRAANLPVGMTLEGNTISGVPKVSGGLFPLEVTVEDQKKATDTYCCLISIK